MRTSILRLAVCVTYACLIPLCVSQTVTNLYSFPGEQGLASPTYGAPVQGRDGRLYGTSTGITSSRSNYDGAVFRYEPGGGVNPLYSFSASSEGGEPDGSVILSTDGNLYGTAFSGGISLTGNVFKVAPNGAYSVLHQFNGDGAYPFAAPIEASDNALYGTTVWNTGDDEGYGTVYKYTPSEGFSTIYDLDSTHGANPTSPVIQATNGNLYGTASAGGTAGCGTMFEITTSGTLLYSYSFQGGAAGCEPIGPLVQASDGNFYGTTLGDATTSNFGTVFRLSKSGNVSVLYNFLGGTADGEYPQAGLVQATDGNLYGTTVDGGTYGNGTIFQITLGGSYTLLYSFPTDVGVNPYATLVQDTDGLLYGTTYGGGTAGDGALYSLDMGLGPFIAFVQATGRAGSTAQILGQSLLGATSVSFNGVPATGFNVVSDTYMTAVVPTSATTGPLVVSTPSSKLKSNKNFRIMN